MDCLFFFLKKRPTAFDLEYLKANPWRKGRKGRRRIKEERPTDKWARRQEQLEKKAKLNKQTDNGENIERRQT